MYIRFTTTAIDEDSKKPRGIFIEAYQLLNSGDLKANEWKSLRATLDWFNANLPHPPEKFKTSRAIFWFKPAAAENIRRVWQLVRLLRAYDRHVVVYKCRRLGNISYSDEFQVAAYPSDNDDRITQH